MATIQDIARISGYSIGTVSRVINHRADVSEEARRKVEEVIQEQNYQPNTSARMLRQSVSSEVSVIVRGINNIFLQSTLEQIQIRVREHGESVNAHFIGETEDEVAMAAQIVQNQKPKGLVFLGGSVQTFREGFSKISVPSVLISSSADGLGYDNLSSFSTDDHEAGGHAVNMLALHGHHRIGILGGYPGDVRGERPDDSVVLRIRGAIETLEAGGIAFDVERDYEACPFSAKGGYQAAKRLLLRTPDLTGVFAISDSIAIGAIRAFHDMGLSVPEDISVIGFDGITISKYSVPRLATIQQDIQMLARRGVDDLLMRVSYECPAVHEKVPYQFINGESVARPRG